MEDVLVPLGGCLTLFVGLPWIIFHYVTQWKKNGSMTMEDENLLDELHALARRLEDRMNTVERIVAADSPGFRPNLRDDRNDDFDTLRDRDRDLQTSRPRRRDH